MIKKEDITFVVIFYEISFWGIYCVEKLICSIKSASLNNKIIIVLNRLNEKQINYIKSYFNFYNNIDYVLPYQSNFIENDELIEFLEFSYSRLNTKQSFVFDEALKEYKKISFFDNFFSHGKIISWILKEYNAGEYLFFIDHDCIVNECFVSEIKEDLLEKFNNFSFVAPKHNTEYGSVTAPMFFINNKKIECLIKRFPDFLFSSFCHFNLKKQKNKIKWENDTLKILFNSLVEKNEAIRYGFGYNEHCWHGATNLEVGLDIPHQNLFKTYFKFKKEYFKIDFEENIKKLELFRKLLKDANIVIKELEEYY